MQLVVIAKECVPGRVKTRLTPTLSQEEAAALALVSLQQTLRTVRGVEVAERVLLLDGDPRGLDTTGYRVEAQHAGPLDERIASAFRDSRTPVLMIGMDTPQVSQQVLQSVVDDEVSDAWFGPAEDGGFWALGLRAPRAELIRGVPMSRSDTGRTQLRRLQEAGLRTSQLPSLVDVDLVEDAADVASRVPGSAFARLVDALGIRDRISVPVS